jgi:hypothetical protein
MHSNNIVTSWAGSRLRAGTSKIFQGFGPPEVVDMDVPLQDRGVFPSNL